MIVPAKAALNALMAIIQLQLAHAQPTRHANPAELVLRVHWKLRLALPMRTVSANIAVLVRAGLTSPSHAEEHKTPFAPLAALARRTSGKSLPAPIPQRRKTTFAKIALPAPLVNTSQDRARSPRIVNAQPARFATLARTKARRAPEPPTHNAQLVTPAPMVTSLPPTATRRRTLNANNARRARLALMSQKDALRRAILSALLAQLALAASSKLPLVPHSLTLHARPAQLALLANTNSLPALSSQIPSALLAPTAGSRLKFTSNQNVPPLPTLCAQAAPNALLALTRLLLAARQRTDNAQLARPVVLALTKLSNARATKIQSANLAAAARRAITFPRRAQLFRIPFAHHAPLAVPELTRVLCAAKTKTPRALRALLALPANTSLLHATPSRTPNANLAVLLVSLGPSNLLPACQQRTKTAFALLAQLVARQQWRLRLARTQQTDNAEIAAPVLTALGNQHPAKELMTQLAHLVPLAPPILS